MIAKTIQFENFAEEAETATFHFNLSKGELVAMQMSAIDHRTESFQDKLEKIGRDLDGKALIETIEEIVKASYGVKTVDGKRFIKNAEDYEVFKSSGAYSELMVELCTNANAAAEFINGLVPSKLREEVKRETENMTARQRSEANFQGFQKKADKPTGSITQEPELPTEVQNAPSAPVIIEGTADPVLEKETGALPEAPKFDVANMSREDLERMALQNSSSFLK